MNEVKKCSLSGVAFTMEHDAYQILNDYLESLNKSYKGKVEGEEIVADIEARIAELILSTQDSGRVVEKPLILNIIRQMGSAEDIADASQESPAAAEQPRIPRRLYRDTENAKLGGVCAGIGRYFDIDPVWVRLVLFAPILLSLLGQVSVYLYWLSSMMGNLFGVFVLGYIGMWFAVPVARTARQKLEMNGEKITAHSIGERTSAAVAGDPDSVARPVVAETVSLLGRVVLLLLKIFAGAIVFCLVMAACCLFVVVFSLLFGNQGSGIILDEFGPYFLAMAVCVVLVPLCMLIYVLMCLIASRRPSGKIILFQFLMWMVTIVCCAVMAIREDVVTKVRHSQISVWHDHPSVYRDNKAALERQKELLDEYRSSMEVQGEPLGEQGSR